MINTQRRERLLMIAECLGSDLFNEEYIDCGPLDNKDLKEALTNGEVTESEVINAFAKGCGFKARASYELIACVIEAE